MTHRILILLFLTFCQATYALRDCVTTTEAAGRTTRNEAFAEKHGMNYVRSYTGGYEEVYESKRVKVKNKDGKTVEKNVVTRTYFKSNGEPVSAGEAERLKDLGIPPKYKATWVSDDPKAHVLAQWKDDKGRTQSRQNPKWEEAKKYEKFERAITFGKALPTLREKVEADLSQEGLTKTRVTAAVVRLLDETQARIGSEKYADENETYGLTTVLPQHVKISQGKLRLVFNGKDDIEHKLPIEDKAVEAVIKEAKELKGEILFSYQNEQGHVHKITAQDINEYLQEVTGEKLTAKDFRTWAGSREAFKIYRARGNLDTKADKKKALADVKLAASNALRNEPGTAGKHYIHSKILDRIEQGKVYQKPEGKPAAAPYLKEAEQELLDFLQE